MMMEGKLKWGPKPWNMVEVAAWLGTLAVEARVGFHGPSYGSGRTTGRNWEQRNTVYSQMRTTAPTIMIHSNK